MGISATDFTFVTQMVKQRSSIDLKPGKEYLVESRLAPLARGLNTDLGGLVTRLRQGDERLREDVVDALTTNETSFFRDIRPFDVFVEYMLPRVVEDTPPHPITIWSAACSSGQEAYSLAMLLSEWLPGRPGWSGRIIGTDISPQMVERARAGRFSQIEVNRGMRVPYLVKYFQQEGRQWVVDRQLRDLCRFERGNLAQPAVNVPTCDIVFLRNVLIYFDNQTKQTVLTNVRRVLRPGGFLVLGGAEATLHLDPAFQRIELDRAMIFQHLGGGR